MARMLVEGAGEGPLLALDEPLSLWGGVDPATGRIIEADHPQAGAVVTETVLVLRHGKGSSSASSVLAEMIRSATAPAGIVVGHPDAILVAGAIVAGELYGRWLPVAMVDTVGWDAVSVASYAVIRADGSMRVS